MTNFIKSSLLLISLLLVLIYCLEGFTKTILVLLEATAAFGAVWALTGLMDVVFPPTQKKKKK